MLPNYCVCYRVVQQSRLTSWQRRWPRLQGGVQGLGHQEPRDSRLPTRSHMTSSSRPSCRLSLPPCRYTSSHNFSSPSKHNMLVEESFCKLPQSTECFNNNFSHFFLKICLRSVSGPSC